MSDDPMSKTKKIWKNIWAVCKTLAFLGKCHKIWVIFRTYCGAKNGFPPSEVD